jgi:4-amino-4-deoxy-L-arabinose transferase-like glycosyltransferase
VRGVTARDSAAVRVPRLQRETWVLVTIVVIGTALRLAWVGYAARPLGFPIGGDPLGYVVRADDLAHGRGYLSLLTQRATAFQPPGWPMLLGGWFWVAHHTPLPDDVWNLAGWLNVGLAAGSMVLLYAIGRRLFDARTGLVAAGAYALWPNLVYYTGTAALELAFVFFTLLVIWLVLRAGYPDGARVSTLGLVLAGLATGELLLIRPFGASVLLTIAIGGLVAGRGWRRTLRDTAVVTVSAIAVLVPWTIRNAVELHGFVPVATNLGETLCIGHQPQANGELVGDTAYCVGPYAAERITTPHLEIARNRYATRQALKYALRHPVDETRLLFWRGYFTAQNDHDGLDAVESGGRTPAFAFIPKRPRAVLVTAGDAYFFVASVLALFAIPAFVRRGPGRGGRVLWFATGVGLLLVPLELYGLPRFKVPLAPFLALAAALTIVRLTTRSRDAASAPPRTAPASPG